MAAGRCFFQEEEMVGAIIGIALGIGVILLGVKGFSREGLPFTNTKRITGAAGQVVGIVCILIGLAFVALSVLPFLLRGR